VEFEFCLRHSSVSMIRVRVGVRYLTYLPDKYIVLTTSTSPQLIIID
jgi:hypothetical protein